MSADATHHIGLRVASLERSIAFYEKVFDARLLVKPFVREGQRAMDIVGGGPEGVRFRICHVGVGAGVLELFEFESPRHAPTRVHPSELAMMHFGIYVDDVHGTMERVLAEGGSHFWKQPGKLGPYDVMYLADPDENVFELMSATIEQTIEQVHAANPGTAPE